jgi:aryl-alcohol dehydrogenase-like predicted oxidoreductase
VHADIAAHRWRCSCHRARKTALLVGEAVEPIRDQLVLANEFGCKLDEQGAVVGLDSRPEHIRDVLNAWLKRLRTDCIDLLS